MPIIQAYKHPRKKRLYSDKQEYLYSLKKEAIRKFAKSKIKVYGNQVFNHISSIEFNSVDEIELEFKKILPIAKKLVAYTIIMSSTNYKCGYETIDLAKKLIAKADSIIPDFRFYDILVCDQCKDLLELDGLARIYGVSYNVSYASVPNLFMQSISYLHIKMSEQFYTGLSCVAQAMEHRLTNDTSAKIDCNAISLSLLQEYNETVEYQHKVAFGNVTDDTQIIRYIKVNRANYVELLKNVKNIYDGCVFSYRADLSFFYRSLTKKP